jgi:competence protein ComEC
MRTLFLLCFLCCTLAAKITIVFIDVEGGQATLIVSGGESLLVDTGWPANNGRDAERIREAAKKVGVKKIDYLLITHYHTDHVGGLVQLLDRMPISTLLTHGKNTETGSGAATMSKIYEEGLKRIGREIILKPGDKIPLKGVDITVLTARGEVIQRKGEANPLCAANEKKADDPSENGKSIAFLLQYGSFRFVDMADITWNVERDLACSENKAGTADLMLGSHHGLAASNNPALVYAMRPKAIIVGNGARKGGEAAVFDWLRKSPGLGDLWQMHFSVAAGADHNQPQAFLANTTEPGGNHLKVTAEKDGSFTILNQRNKFEKTY